MRKARTRKSANKRGRRQARRPRRGGVVSPRAIEATLAELAHDIRTPLTGILALGELLATSDLAERERGWAAAIKSTAEHLAMLTSLIVDAARAQRKGLVLRRDLIRPRALAESVMASLAGQGGSKELKTELSLAHDLPKAVIGDAVRLRAALQNLTDNAVKFTERGAVTLDVASEPLRGDAVRLTFTVVDTGIGLSAAEIKRLFRPFAQANEKIARRYGGAGLGLAFVKRVAKAMGGDLTVTSTVGGGSRFALSVRVQKVADAQSPAEGAAAARAATLRPLNVLCIEDNPYGRVVLNTILTELGHRADFVGTGEAAIDAVTRSGYDVVLMDVTLPGIGGLEAVRRIRVLPGAAAHVPVVGISGRTNIGDEAAARAAGMDGFLTKPLSPSGLAQMLEALVPAPR